MATIFRKEDAMTVNMEFGPKLVNDTIVALRPVLSNVRSDDALSTLKGDIERLQKEWRANAQEREILKKIGKAGEVQDKPALSKFLSQINDEAQRGSNVGISVKLLSESVRSVVDQAEDDSAVGPSARYLTTQDKERYTRIIVGTVAGFAAGTAASGGQSSRRRNRGIGVGLVTAWANPK